MSFCPNCGASNESGNKFCMFCGTTLDVPSPAAAPAPEPAPVDNAEPIAVAEPILAQPVQPVQPIQAQPVSQPIPAPIQPMASSRMSSAYAAPASTNGLCIAGMVISLVSILCCGLLSWLGFLLSLIGLIIACAKKQRGKGMAITGIIVSLILMALIAFVYMSGSNRSAVRRYLREAGFDEDTIDWMDTDDDDDDDYEPTRSTVDDDDDSQSYDIDTGWARQQTTKDKYGKYHTRITYTKGVPDDFVLYGNTTFGDVAKAIKNNNQIKNRISNQVIEFDIEMFRRVATIYWFGPEEYGKMKSASDRQTCLATLAYLATLSFEFTNDKFVPEYAEYDDLTTTYEYHGVLDANNLGHSIIVFTDDKGNDVKFDEAMCGDEIVWTFDFGKPDKFLIGMDADSQKEYPANNFASTANYFASLIDPVL